MNVFWKRLVSVAFCNFLLGVVLLSFSKVARKLSNLIFLIGSDNFLLFSTNHSYSYVLNAISPLSAIFSKHRVNSKFTSVNIFWSAQFISEKKSDLKAAPLDFVQKALPHLGNPYLNITEL